MPTKPCDRYSIDSKETQIRVPRPSRSCIRAHAHAKHRPFTGCYHSNVYRLMELELESKLSRGPALEDHDTTALTKEQQERLNQHKVLRHLGRPVIDRSGLLEL